MSDATAFKVVGLEISERLKFLLPSRAEREKISELTGVHLETVRRYLTGTVPSVEFIVAVCRTFNVSADWLLQNKGPMRLGSVEHDLDLVPFPSLLKELSTRTPQIRRHLDSIDALARDFSGVDPA